LGYCAASSSAQHKTGWRDSSAENVELPWFSSITVHRIVHHALAAICNSTASLLIQPAWRQQQGLSLCPGRKDYSSFCPSLWLPSASGPAPGGTVELDEHAPAALGQRH
jgi:hypothetical protein